MKISRMYGPYSFAPEMLVNFPIIKTNAKYVENTTEGIAGEITSKLLTYLATPRFSRQIITKHGNMKSVLHDEESWSIFGLPDRTDLEYWGETTLMTYDNPKRRDYEVEFLIPNNVHVGIIYKNRKLKDGIGDPAMLQRIRDLLKRKMTPFEMAFIPSVQLDSSLWFYEPEFIDDFVRSDRFDEIENAIQNIVGIE